MQHENPRSPAAAQPVKAKQIVHYIVQQDDPQNMRKNLRQMFDCFFLEYEGAPAEMRYSMYSTYDTLYRALTFMETWSITHLDKKDYQRRVAEAEEYLLQLRNKLNEEE